MFGAGDVNSPRPRVPPVAAALALFDDEGKELAKGSATVSLTTLSATVEVELKWTNESMRRVIEIVVVVEEVKAV